MSRSSSCKPQKQNGSSQWIMHFFPKMWPQTIFTGSCECFTSSETKNSAWQIAHCRSSGFNSSSLIGSSFVSMYSTASATLRSVKPYPSHGGMTNSFGCGVGDVFSSMFFDALIVVILGDDLVMRGCEKNYPSIYHRLLPGWMRDGKHCEKRQSHGPNQITISDWPKALFSFVFTLKN